MGFESYYGLKEVGASLVTHDEVYYTAFDRLTRFPTELADPTQESTFILGGFHPSSGIPEKFIEFTQRVHPNPADRHILLDVNSDAFRSLEDRDKYHELVQSALQRMPFRDGSVHAILLDHTMQFMDDSTLSAFGAEAQRVLSPNGLVLAAIEETKISWIDRIARRKSNKVDTHPRSPKNVNAALNGHLKPVLVADYKMGPYNRGTMLAYSQMGSGYGRFTGPAFDYTGYDMQEQHRFAS